MYNGITIQEYKVIKVNKKIKERIKMSHYDKTSTNVSISENEKNGIYKAMFDACTKNDIETIKNILNDYGEWIDVNKKINSGQTVLWNSIDGGERVAITKLILEYGGDPNIYCDYGTSPFTVSFGNVYGVVPSTVKMLLEYGADVDARDNDGTTALMSFCAMENAEMVEYLLAAYQPNKNIRNNTGYDVYGIAERINNAEITKLLNKNFDNKTFDNTQKLKSDVSGSDSEKTLDETKVIHKKADGTSSKEALNTCTFGYTDKEYLAYSKPAGLDSRMKRSKGFIESVAQRLYMYFGKHIKKVGTALDGMPYKKDASWDNLSEDDKVKWAAYTFKIVVLLNEAGHCIWRRNTMEDVIDSLGDNYSRKKTFDANEIEYFAVKLNERIAWSKNKNNTINEYNVDSMNCTERWNKLSEKDKEGFRDIFRPLLFFIINSNETVLMNECT